MERLLTNLSRSEVETKLQRVEPTESRSSSIADELSLTVFDQPEACKAVGRRLAMFETNLSDPNRPLGVLYFMGSPGTGKTEMSHAVSTYMFQKPDSPRLKIINMSEYSEDHYAARFVGSPPGYVDYDQPPVISHDWLHKGRSVIVLDEIEKAAPKVIRTLLPVLDKGRLDARAGRGGIEPLDFRNSLIILTSNTASGQIRDIMSGKGKGIGFGSNDARGMNERAKEAAQKGLKAQFPPEFLDRVDDFVIFNPLEKPETLSAIVTKFIGERNDHFRYVLGDNAPHIELTTEAREFITGQAGKEGGRAIKKALEMYVFDRMADVISSVDYFRRPFVADIKDGNTEWYTDDPAPAEIKAVVPFELPKIEPRHPTPPAPQYGGKNDDPIDDSGDRVGSGDSDKSGEKNKGKDKKKEELKADTASGRLINVFAGEDSGKMVDIFIRVKEKGEPDAEAYTQNIKLGQ